MGRTAPCTPKPRCDATAGQSGWPMEPARSVNIWLLLAGPKKKALFSKAYYISGYRAGTGKKFAGSLNSSGAGCCISSYEWVPPKKSCSIRLTPLDAKGHARRLPTWNAAVTSRARLREADRGCIMKLRKSVGSRSGEGGHECHPLRQSHFRKF